MYIFYSCIIGLIYWIIPFVEIGRCMAILYSNIPMNNIILGKMGKMFEIFKYYVEYDDLICRADA